MDNKLSKLINNNSYKFNDWTQIINEHNFIFNPDKDLKQKEQIELTHKTSNVLVQISDLFFKYGSFKDTFDNSKMFLHVYGPNLIIKSNKTNNQFNLGIDNKGIYLETYMRFAENLRYMPDSFYKAIFTLMELGNFELQENQFYGKETTNKYNQLFNNQKSKLFKLFRNYIVGVAEGESDIILGDFHIHWTYDKNFYNIISNSCLAFKILYKLNYSLWKINDLKTKKKKI
ncbi:MAG: hypothetical protein R2750_04290 [Bacteroidales bacterium]